MHVMENLILTPDSKNAITDYIESARLLKHEVAILDEMLEAISAKDLLKLEWFSQFGPTSGIST